jgi:uncharacterized membrane protein YfcA
VPADSSILTAAEGDDHVELSVSPYVLALLFFGVALIYSSVGLGGGSSYTALLAIFGAGTLVIPIVTLTLNICVTTVGSFNFIRSGHARMRLILPFLLASIPMAYLGGALHLRKDVFYWILIISLIFVALRIYVWQDTSITLTVGKNGKILISLAAGSLLGLVSGIVGIGGGIYLIPLIIILGLGTSKEAAAAGSIFIWINSLSGLISRLQHNPIDLLQFIPLIGAVIAGGTLGSFMGSFRFSPKTMEKILGGIVLLAIALLLRKTVLQ